MSEPPALELAFEARIRVAPPMELGAVGGTLRRIVPILGGEVSGKRLQGTVLPGGADWQNVQEDGLTNLTARYTLQAADGTLISVVNQGIRHGPPDVIRRMLAGQAVEPGSYYFRASPVFEVRQGPHDWLLRHVFLCTGARRPDRVELCFYAVL
jgi:hypothetical protein